MKTVKYPAILALIATAITLTLTACATGEMTTNSPKQAAARQAADDQYQTITVETGNGGPVTFLVPKTAAVAWAK